MLKQLFGDYFKIGLLLLLLLFALRVLVICWITVRDVVYFKKGHALHFGISFLNACTIVYINTHILVFCFYWILEPMLFYVFSAVHLFIYCPAFLHTTACKDCKMECRILSLILSSISVFSTCINIFAVKATAARWNHRQILI